MRPIPRPRQLVWEVTARCDQRCAHCYNVWTAAGEVTPADLPLPVMLQILDRVAAGERTPASAQLTAAAAHARDLRSLADVSFGTIIPLCEVSGDTTACLSRRVAFPPALWKT